MGEKRDPRVNPRAGDVLDLIGWRCEVQIADRDGVIYRRKGCLAVPGEIVDWPLERWRSQMGKHGKVLQVTRG